MCCAVVGIDIWVVSIHQLRLLLCQDGLNLQQAGLGLAGVPWVRQLQLLQQRLLPGLRCKLQWLPSLLPAAAAELS